MSINYAYQYARVRETDGLCIGAEDTTTYILNRIHVPIDDADGPYLLKYYWPLPEAPVTRRECYRLEELLRELTGATVSVSRNVTVDEARADTSSFKSKFEEVNKAEIKKLKALQGNDDLIEKVVCATMNKSKAEPKDIAKVRNIISYVVNNGKKSKAQDYYIKKVLELGK